MVDFIYEIMTVMNRTLSKRIKTSYSEILNLSQWIDDGVDDGFFVRRFFLPVTIQEAISSNNGLLWLLTTELDNNGEIYIKNDCI